MSQQFNGIIKSQGILEVKDIRQQYYNRDIRRHIDRFNCDYCQRNKLEGRGYGLLPEREVQSIPFEECAVDLIGPWVVQIHGNC